MLNGHVSHWWSEIGTPRRRPELPGNLTVDVGIVGAGYTGLWTAYYLKRAQPTLRIAVVEQHHVGYGASGRNGGWLCNTVTGGKEQYVPGHGVDAAERFQRAMNETVDEVIRVAGAEGIDADIRRGGELNVAYTPAQLKRLDAFYEAERAFRYTDIERLSAAESQAKVNVAGTLGGVWQPHAARIHPAKLVKGLADAVEALGVEIYERTRAVEISPTRVRTTHGTLTAPVIVRATEGFTAALKGLKREWLPMNSSMIATEPLPERVWDELNWRNGEVMGDFAHVYMYAQRTADNRIAFGGRGVPYRYGSRTDNDGTTQEVTARTLGELMHRFFPITRDYEIAHLWSGVLGVPRDWSPTVTFDRATGLAWAGGYVGTGVAQSNLAGRTLRDLILGIDTEITALPWVGHRVRQWEPEPLRWIATKTLYAAYGMADRRELRGGERTSPLAKIADVITGR